MPNWVTIRLHAARTGLSEKAIRAKIERGIWPEGVWRKADDGRIYVSEVAFDKWVEGRVSEVLGAPYRLIFDTRASAVERGSGSRRRHATSSTRHNSRQE